MADLISAVLRGMTFGSIYGLLAVGLVLTFKTSGVFNLAYGAQAFTVAAVYFDTRVRHHWPIPAALILAVFIIAPLTGYLLDRLLFRFLRNASSAARLVTVLGLLVAIPQAVDLWFGSANSSATGVVPNGLTVYHPFGSVFLYRDDIATILITLAIVIGLGVLFRFTALGLRMRAVVESSRMTELAGVNAERVSRSSWMLASFLAGLTGVLIAPALSQVNNVYYTPLVVAAISAAVLASLSSIPIAFAGGLALGVLQQILSIYLPTNSVLATNLRPSLPFVVLFLILIFSPSLRNRRDVADPLAGVAPPPPQPIARERSRELTIALRTWWTVVLGLTGYYVFFHANVSWVQSSQQAVIFAIMFCSIVVITGMAGEISLCQATFAAIGGFVTYQLSTSQGMSVIVAIVIGAVVAAAVGAVLAIPVLRLGGIYLSLATLAFALFFENVMVKFSWIAGSPSPAPIPRPQLGGVDFASEKSFLLLCIVVLLLVGGALSLIRTGTTGRVLAALRGSEVASASIGINGTRTRIVAFALSAAIAGLGGGLLATANTQVNFQSNYSTELGLVWIVLVVSLGSRSFEGALQAAASFIFFPLVILQEVGPWIVNHVQPWYTITAMPAGITAILFGVGALTYAKHPEGLLEFNTRKSLVKAQARIDKFKAKRAQRKLGTAGAGTVVSLLDATEITKTFAGITALDQVSLDVERGEIVGLIGPNGAGKTTFFNCLLGMLKPDRGSVRFDGHDLTRVPTHRRARLGIGRTFQRIELFAEMTPREHLLVAERVRRGDGALWKDLIGRGRPKADELEKVEATIELLGLADVADRPIEALSLGRGRVVEVGRALMTQPSLLLLDEPSSGLDHHETIELAQKLREVNEVTGAAILLVEHDVEMVRSLVTRVFVLDFGTLIASGPTDEVFSEAAVRHAYLGDVV